MFFLYLVYGYIACSLLKMVMLPGSHQNQSVSADAKRREEAIKILRGEWDSVPSEPPTQVRIYLSANGPGSTQMQGRNVQESFK